MYSRSDIVIVQTNDKDGDSALKDEGCLDDFVNSSLWTQIATPRNAPATTTTITTTSVISNHDSEGISLLLSCSRFQSDVVETTKELHDLTDRIESIHRDPPVLEDINIILPPLMASLMERREKAKRLYRSTLNSHIESYELDIERIFNELEKELARTDELLALHPRRGTFY